MIPPKIAKGARPENEFSIFFWRLFCVFALAQRPGLYVWAIVVQQLPVFLLASLRSGSSREPVFSRAKRQTIVQ